MCCVSAAAALARKRSSRAAPGPVILPDHVFTSLRKQENLRTPAPRPRCTCWSLQGGCSGCRTISPLCQQTVGVTLTTSGAACLTTALTAFPGVGGASPPTMHYSSGLDSPWSIGSKDFRTGTRANISAFCRMKNTKKIIFDHF